MQATPSRKRLPTLGDLEAEKNYDEQIAMIKSDLAFKSENQEEDKNSKQNVLETLKVLILCNRCDIQKQVTHILKETKEEWIKIEIHNFIKEYIQQIIDYWDLKEFVDLYSLWKEYNFDLFCKLAADSLAMQSSNSTVITEFLINSVVPSILGTQGHSVNYRIVVIEIATFLTKFVHLEMVEEQKLNDFVELLPKSISQLSKDDKELCKTFVGFIFEYFKLAFFDKKYETILNEIFICNLKDYFVTYVKEKMIIKAIESHNKVDVVSNLYTCWKSHDLPKFSDILKDAVKTKSNILRCKVFFLETLMPMVLQPPNKDFPNETRDKLIDLAFEFVPSLPISWWLPEELDKFLKNVTGDNGYIKNIQVLSQQKYENWYKLWMFLVRVFAKKLHKNMVIFNSFLSVAEKAFRSNEIPERLRGYDCWQELIDNVALDKNYLSSSKQIKLLITPLRAKFSKQEAVIVRRFELFVYLIEKLQSNGVLILKEFLEFCFGEVGENTDPTKAGGGKSLPQLWIRSAKVLMAIIGHSHKERALCLPTSDIKIPSRLITQSNIVTHYYHVLNSLAECSKLLKDVELGEQKQTVLDCLWRSISNTVLSHQSDKRPQFVALYGKILENLLATKDVYYNSVASIIFKVVMNMDLGKVHDLITDNLKTIMKIVFTVPMTEQTTEVEKLCVILFNGNTPEKRQQIKKDIISSFTDYKTCETNANNIGEIWVNLASELDAYANGKSLDYLLWPALHLGHMEPNSKIKIDLTESYRALVSCHVEKQKDLHIGLLSSYEKVLKNNPLLANNIMILMELFSFNLENIETLTLTLRIFSQILILPNTESIDTHTIKNIEQFIKKCLGSAEFAQIDNTEILLNFCKCIEYLFKAKQYGCVEKLEIFIKNLPENLQLLYSNYVSVDFLMDIYNQEKDLLLHKVIDYLKKVKDSSAKKQQPKSPFPVKGRAAKIANLARNSPEPTNNESTSSGLRLFGKNVDTLTPIKVKGSILNNPSTPGNKNKSTRTPTSSSVPKKDLVPSIMDESTSEFVPINTEVKIVPELLTEHQKESLKKRREDIPALYEDLSQSQSQSLSSVDALDKTKAQFKSPEPKKTNENTTDNSIGTKTNLKKNAEDPETKRKVPDDSDNCLVQNENTEKLSSNEVEIPTAENLETVSKKEQKIKAELRKLQINIVGADEFLSPSRAKRVRKSILPIKKGGEVKKEDAEKKSADQKIEETKKSVQRGRKKKVSDTDSQKIESTDQPSTSSENVSTPKATVSEAKQPLESQDLFSDNAEMQTAKNPHEKSAKKRGRAVKNVGNTETNLPVQPQNEVGPAKKRKSTRSGKDDNELNKNSKNEEASEGSRDENKIEAPFEDPKKSEQKPTIGDKPNAILTMEPTRSENSVENSLESNRKELESSLNHPNIKTRERLSKPKELTSQTESGVSGGLESPKDFLLKVARNSDNAQVNLNSVNDMEKDGNILESPTDTIVTRITRQSRGVNSPMHKDSSANPNGLKNTAKKTRGASQSPVSTSVEKKLSRRQIDHSVAGDKLKAVKQITFEAKQVKGEEEQVNNENHNEGKEKKANTPQVQEEKVIGDLKNDELTSLVPKSDKKQLKKERKDTKNIKADGNTVSSISRRSRLIQNMALNKSDDDIGKICDKLEDERTPKGFKSKESNSNIDEKKVEVETELRTTANDESHETDKEESSKPSRDDENVEIDNESKKRKRPTSDSDSEDMIESSQESVTPINSLRYRNLSRLSSLLNGSKDTSPLNQSDDFKSKSKAAVEVKKPKICQEIDDEEVEISLRKSTSSTPEVTEQCKSHVLESPKRSLRPRTTPEKNSDVNTSKKDLIVVKRDLKVHLEMMDTNFSQDLINRSTQAQNKDVTLDSEADVSKQMKDFDTQTQDTQTQDTQTQDTQTQETETESYDPTIKTSEETPEFIQLDLPQRPELTDSEKVLARMETETLTETELNQMLDSSKESVEDKTESQVDDSIVTINAENHSLIPPDDQQLVFDNDTQENTSNNFGTEKMNDERFIDPNDDTKVDADEMINANKETVEVGKTTDVQNKNDEDQETLNGSPIRDEVFEHLNDLPSSPVTGDTPNRTTELLNSTSDISPIKSKSSPNFDEEDYSTGRLVPIALKFDEEDGNLPPAEKSPEPADSPLNLPPAEKSPETADSPPETKNDISPEKTDTLKQFISEIKSEKHQNGTKVEPDTEINTIDDSMPMLLDADHVEMDNRIEVLQEGKSIFERSAKLFELVKDGGVSQKIIHKRKSGGVTMSPSASRIKKLMLNMKCPTPTAAAETVSKDDILTFSRDVPSPLAVPKSSILKRKHPECEDSGYSPASKDLFGESVPDETFSEGESMETEQSCQMTNATMLRKDKPIYSALTDCRIDVGEIVKKVTSPMFVKTLESKLKSQGINTIGDIATLSEAEVNRYPFKTPVVTNVYKALDTYYKKAYQNKISVDSGVSAKSNSSSSDSETSPQSGKLRKSGAISNKEARKKLTLFNKAPVAEIKEMESLDEKMTIEQLGNIVISGLECQNIRDCVKERININIQDIIDTKHYPEALRTIVSTLGVSEVFDIMKDCSSSLSKEELFCNKVVEYSSKEPLERIIQTRSLEEVENCLSKCVEDETFTKEEMESFTLRNLERHPINPSQVVKKVKLEELDPQDGISVVSRILNAETINQDHLVEIFKMVSAKLPSNILMNLTIDFLRNLPIKE